MNFLFQWLFELAMDGIETIRIYKQTEKIDQRNDRVNRTVRE